MVRTEYHISGEGGRVVEDAELEEDHPVVVADDLMGVTGEAAEETEEHWAHHASDGRAHPEMVAAALARIEDSDLPVPLQDSLRTHLLAHQRAAAAFEKRRGLKR